MLPLHHPTNPWERTHFKDGRPSPTKDHTVQRASHWPLCDRLASLKKFKDLLKKSLTACCIDHGKWEMLAANQVTWQHTVWQATSLFENNQRTRNEKRKRQKNHDTLVLTIDQTFTYGCCGKICLFWISLISHQCACSGCGPSPS